MKRSATLALVCMMAAGAVAANAQTTNGLRRGVVTDSLVMAPFTHVRPDSSRGEMRSWLDRTPTWTAPIASAILPGLGQARLGKERFVGYMAIEGYLLLQYTKNRNEDRDAAASYRAIARDVSRRSFPGSHPDSVWTYYERMQHYLESGAFSRAPSGPTSPETDTTTYNGAQWVRARLTYGISLEDPNPTGDPRYASALALYESRAITAAYGWSWLNAQLEKDLYTRTIGRSNDAARRATSDLIALLANHILSSLDAFASVRLMQTSSDGMRVSASVPVR